MCAEIHSPPLKVSRNSLPEIFTSPVSAFIRWTSEWPVIQAQSSVTSSLVPAGASLA
jgi:hypothetical protein